MVPDGFGGVEGGGSSVGLVGCHAHPAVGSTSIAGTSPLGGRVASSWVTRLGWFGLGGLVGLDEADWLFWGAALAQIGMGRILSRSNAPFG